MYSVWVRPGHFHPLLESEILIHVSIVPPRRPPVEVEWEDLTLNYPERKHDLSCHQVFSLLSGSLILNQADIASC